MDDKLKEIQTIIKRLQYNLDKAWDKLIDYRHEFGRTNDYLEDRIIELEEDIEYWTNKFYNLGVMEMICIDIDGFEKACFDEEIVEDYTTTPSDKPNRVTVVGRLTNKREYKYIRAFRG